MNFLFRFITILLLGIFSGSAQTISHQKIDDFINYIEKNNRAIGSVSIYKNGKEVYYRDFGQQNLPEINSDKNTKYQIGSITKMVTATLIFKLIEDKQLQLDDKLSTFFPDMPNADKISILHLLNHTSGLGDVNFKDGTSKWLKEKKETNEAILNQIKQQGVLFEAGEDQFYSNSAYYLLGKILEIKHQKKYHEIVECYIAKPLALENFQSAGAHPENIFPSYQFKNNQWQVAQDFVFENVIAFGDISATTTDMNTFINAFFQYKIINEENVNVMKPKEKEYLGSGLTRPSFYNIELYGHGGDTNGSHSLLVYDEKNNLSIAIATNGNRSVKNDLYKGILGALYDINIMYPLFIEDEILNQYIGVYSAPDYPFKIKITNEGGALYGKGLAENQISFLLKPKSATVFDCEGTLQAEFKTDKKQMLFTESGEVFEFTKEEMDY